MPVKGAAGILAYAVLPTRYTLIDGPNRILGMSETS